MRGVGLDWLGGLINIRYMPAHTSLPTLCACAFPHSEFEAKKAPGDGVHTLRNGLCLKWRGQLLLLVRILHGDGMYAPETCMASLTPSSVASELTFESTVVGAR